MKKAKNYMLSIILPTAFLLLWAMLAKNIDKPLVLPKISIVFDLLIHPKRNLIGIGSILKNTYISFLRVLCGYLLSVIIAVPLGIVIGFKKENEKFFMPFLSFFRSVPPMEWVPLVLAWCGVASLATVFGVNIKSSSYILLNNIRISMLIIIFLGGFFPVLSNTIFGMKSVPKSLLQSGCEMGASVSQMLVKIYIPYAMPAIFTGLQVGLGTAWMCLICAEMLPGSIAGIGYMISHAYQVTRIDIVMVGIIAISIVSFIIDIIFDIVGKKCYRWYFTK